MSARICLIYGLSDLWLYKVLAAPYPSLPPNYRCELLRLSSVIPSQRTVQGAQHILDYRSVLYGTAPALAPVLTYRWGHHLPKAEGVKPKIRGNSCLCISNRTLSSLLWIPNPPGGDCCNKNTGQMRNRLDSWATQVPADKKLVRVRFSSWTRFRAPSWSPVCLLLLTASLPSANMGF